MEIYRRSGILRLAGFVIIPAVAAISPLIALPAVTKTHGADGWAAVAIGQSIGAACAVLIELGWGLNGPQKVAQLTTAERGREFRLSLLVRLAAFAIVAPFGVAITALLTEQHQTTAIISTLAGAAIGLSASWYYTGTAKPLSILFQESLPKLLLVTLATILLFKGADLAIYPICLLIAGIYSPSIARALQRRIPEDTERITWSDIVQSLRNQRVALTGRAFSSFYIALPTALVSIASPQSTALFAAAERLQRMTLAILQSIPNSLQSWIGKANDPSEVRKRIKRTIIGNSILGAVFGTAFAIAAPWGAHILFSGSVDLTHQITSFCGLVIFATMSSRSTGGLALVRLGRIRSVTVSAIAGCAIGLPLILISAYYHGALGAVAAQGLTEIIVLSIQILALRKNPIKLRSSRTKPVVKIVREDVHAGSRDPKL